MHNTNDLKHTTENKEHRARNKEQNLNARECENKQKVKGIVTNVSKTVRLISISNPKHDDSMKHSHVLALSTEGKLVRQPPRRELDSSPPRLEQSNPKPLWTEWETEQTKTKKG